MSNIKLITAREYLTRVKKKSFILMTLLTPLLIAGFYGVIIWVSIGQSSSTEQMNIIVVDPTGIFADKLENPDNTTYLYANHYTKDDLLASDSIDALITIPSDFSLENKQEITYESISALSASNNGKIESSFHKAMQQQRLVKIGLEQSDIDRLKTKVYINQYKVDKDGSTTSSNLGVNSALGVAMSFIIYMFIFLYGVQVMKGVIEEKTNRIVELIVSTVKPFELMVGKVLGIALVGLTQLTIWVLLSSILMGVIGLIIGLNISDLQHLQNLEGNTALAKIDVTQLQFFSDFLALPLGKIFGVFVFYFLGGYLFYGALFAAIGSAVDSETDTQQFMFPVSIPLVFAIAVSFSTVVGDPNGTLATWLSMIPLTSPISMMVRLPFLTPAENWQLILSMLILLVSILGAIWFAGKIYRTGILMYGKKVSYKELGKWLFYKN